MKKYLDRLDRFWPNHEIEIDKSYSLQKWKQDLQDGDLKFYSQYKFKDQCKKNCSDSEIENIFDKICKQNLDLISLICSEDDEIYGLSSHREAYSLLGQSQIINTYNKRGEALACLRRFSEKNSYKEVNYPALRMLFPVIQDFLKNSFKERFLQGRSFHLGAFKEFEQKGLAYDFSRSKSFNVSAIKDDSDLPIVTKVVEEKTKPVPTQIKESEVVPVQKIIHKNEIQEIPKSAFLQAAEIRRNQDLRMVEVDMLKLKYDYVFSLNIRNKLSIRLKTFMTRDALREMANFDKLGNKEGPVPLLFIKYMIDMQEHQGLWNLLSVIGENFYVSNEIDSHFKPVVEFIKLQNDPSFDGNWRIFILEP